MTETKPEQCGKWTSEGPCAWPPGHEGSCGQCGQELSQPVAPAAPEPSDFARGRLFQFLRMKKERPIDPTYWDMHEERNLKELVEAATAPTSAPQKCEHGFAFIDCLICRKNERLGTEPRMSGVGAGVEQEAPTADARHILYSKYRAHLPSYYNLYGADYAAIEPGNHAHRRFDSLVLTQSLTFGQIADEMEAFAAERVSAALKKAKQCDPFEYVQGECCGDAHMALQSSLEHITVLGFEVTRNETEGLTEIMWHNRRAEKAEREVEQLRAGPPSLRALMLENLELVREVNKLQAKLDYCAKHHMEAGD